MVVWRDHRDARSGCQGRAAAYVGQQPDARTRRVDHVERDQQVDAAEGHVGHRRVKAGTFLGEAQMFGPDGRAGCRRRR